MIVPAPAQAPSRISGFIRSTYRPKRIDTMCGVKEQMRPTMTRLMPVFWSPATKPGPAVIPTTPMKTHRPTVSKIQIAASGNPPEEGPHRPEPPEHEPHDQGAAAGGEGERHPRDRHRQEADEAAEHDTGADEDHVRGGGGAVGVPDCLDRRSTAGFGPISVTTSPRSTRVSGRRHLLPGPGELLQEDPAGELAPRQLGQALAGQRPCSSPPRRAPRSGCRAAPGRGPPARSCRPAPRGRRGAWPPRRRHPAGSFVVRLTLDELALPTDP